MLTSEDAANVVGSPAATFVCLGRQLALQRNGRLHPTGILGCMQDF